MSSDPGYLSDLISPTASFSLGCSHTSLLIAPHVLWGHAASGPLHLLFPLCIRLFCPVTVRCPPSSPSGLHASVTSPVTSFLATLTKTVTPHLCTSCPSCSAPYSTSTLTLRCIYLLLLSASCPDSTQGQALREQGFHALFSTKKNAGHVAESACAEGTNEWMKSNF